MTLYEEPSRRHLISIVSGHYESSALNDLPGVQTEKLAIEEWLQSEKLSGREFVTLFPKLAQDPPLRAVRRALRNSPELKSWREGDAVIVFVTGHGTVKHNRHWLLLTNSDSERLYSTALATEDLLGWLMESNPEHLLLILDACFSGQSALDFAGFAGHVPETWVLIASAAKDETAETGALTHAIQDFIEYLSSSKGESVGHEKYLPMGKFLEELRVRLPRNQTLTLLQTSMPPSGPSPLLPNPWYSAEQEVSIGSSRRDLSLRPDDLAAHWGPRARGVGSASDPGWLFTGRRPLMRALVEATTGDPQTILITGGAGTGKSTVLARLVTLSDDLFVAANRDRVELIPSDLRPAVGAIDAALLATGKYPKELMVQLLEAIGLDVTRTMSASLDDCLVRWRDWLRSRSTSVTVVIDAVDESEDPRALLRMLSKLESGDAEPKVRLFIGIRSVGSADEADTELRDQSSLAELAGQWLAPWQVRVDEPPWWDQADIAEYATAVLMSGDGTVETQRDPESARSVGEVLAENAGKSFLIARIAASALADRPISADSRGSLWVEAVRKGVVGVFGEDLRHTFPEPADRMRAVHILRATAFAHGRGTPWSQVWPRMASAIAGDGVNYGDGDIAWLLGSRLGAYLVSGSEDGATIYRPFHDVLRDTLRDDWMLLVGGSAEQSPASDIGQVEARIAAELRDLARERVGVGGMRLPPEPYVRRHLADHALAGGVLEDGFLPQSFIPYLDISRLQSILARHSRSLGDILSRVLPTIAHLWDWDHPDANAAAIETWAAISRIAPHLRRTEGPWGVNWAASNEQGILLGRNQSRSLGHLKAIVTPTGRTIAVTSDGPRLRIWDLDSGSTVVHEDLKAAEAPYSPWISSLATTISGDGVAVAVHGDTLDGITLWDVDTGRRIGHASRTTETSSQRVDRESDVKRALMTAIPLASGVLAVAEDRGDWVQIVALGEDPSFYNYSTGSQVTSLDSFRGPAGTALVIAGCANGQVFIISLADDGSPSRSWRTPASASSVTSATGIWRPDDRCVVVWNEAGGLVRVAFLDLETRAMRIRRSVLASDCARMAVPICDGDRILAAMQTTLGSYRVVDVMSGMDVVEPLSQPGVSSNAAAGGLVEAVSDRLAELLVLTHDANDQPVLIASWDDVVYAWDLTSGTHIGAPRVGHARAILALAALRNGAGDVIAVTEAADSSVRKWNIGEPVPSPLTPVSSLEPVVASRLIRGPGGVSVAVLGQRTSRGTSVRALDATTGAHVLNDYDSSAFVLGAADFAAVLDGRVLGVLGGTDGSVEAFDLVGGQRLGDPWIEGHPSAVTSALVAEFDGAPFAITGSVGGSIASWELDGRLDQVGFRHLHDGAISAIRYFNGGSGPRLVTAGHDLRLVITDLATLEPVAQPILGHTAGLTALDVFMTSSGPIAVTGQADGDIRFWDLNTGTALGPPIAAHSDLVSAVALAELADGSVVAISAARDRTAVMWDVGSQSPFGDPIATPGIVFSLATSRDFVQPQLVIAGGSVSMIELRHRSARSSFADWTR
jgi:WD40 repeat protein